MPLELNYYFGNEVEQYSYRMMVQQRTTGLVLCQEKVQVKRGLFWLN